MKFGAGFPITASTDTVAIRDFAQTLDGAGFDLLTTAGHLLGVEPGRLPDRPTVTYAGPFHDPFVLFSYLAGITQRLHFRPTILILPLYATAVVAKQAAELQMLSGGRFELGVGISWNPIEYRAVDQDPSIRGRRIAEQIAVLRAMWSEPYPSFEGRWHTLDGVGIGRVPAQPIPIWMGSGTGDVALRRVARLADGWIPMGDPTEIVPRLKQFVREAGRDVDAFGLTARLVAGPGGPDAWIESARRMQALGATYLTLAAPPELQGEGALQRLVEARDALAAELGSEAPSSALGQPA
jgi:probable F420-dependent oxidoreductase